ncbi:Pycsar system effector family protein [Streptomyces agglomeratus]|uniref:Pycsar system effector family protein n=1 Tax=Streptomyces agglomeratus TaxID=285458 RepID=UPI00114CA67C|nr:Pycsar system effector family protein [Streptomyces agglomeratus]
MEVQRADVKATALSGVAGALLAVGTAGLSSPALANTALQVALKLACVLLALALIAALSAIRPSVRSKTVLMGLGHQASGIGGAKEVADAFETAARSQDLRAGAERLSTLAGLAAKKFKSIRVAVDLTVSALIVTGIGILTACITS